MADAEDDFELPLSSSDTLTLAIDGWEGPLDLLLTLARAQKVDLREISILALVEQYLAFIAGARAMKLELPASRSASSPLPWVTSRRTPLADWRRWE